MPLHRSLLLALLAGALNILAFAPFGLWPLQILSLAAVLPLALRAGSGKRSALIGWAYGFGWTGCGVYWLYISMHDFGGMAAPVAALAVILLALCLGGYAALAFGLCAWLRQRWQAAPACVALLIFPALWALSEWLRGWVFTGLPWVASGYAHSASPLAGYAPLLGVYGLAWIAALIAGCLTLLSTRKAPLALLLALALLAAGLCLKTVRWTSAAGQPITVRLLQGNVAQEMKFARDQIRASLDLYRDLIGAAPADLIATPETAIPLLAQQLPPEYLPQLADFARRSGSHLAIGIPLGDSPQRYTNSVIGLAPDRSALNYRYDKHHLVPFGEFIPSGFRWFVDLMQIPLGDFSSGPAVQAPFAVKDQWLLPNICYEDLFGEEIAGQLKASHAAGAPVATVLLNVSNIAWFGDTVALPQHLQISQMRALETGRPMLRATNTGTTAIIDPQGRVVAQLQPYQRGTLAASVQGMQGMTPYILAGNGALLLLAALALAAGWLAGRKNHSNRA
ncbi:apolipoprotein N-acyltransferase [Herminiimonas sp. CN]|uniref:apolipoprotein N-acyltransferase n=1 Tax=Herminiimonas sp. CN TaxID=1349818 RepID=UPI000473B26D|nr:apolipoprotein N-acyltransferase [Herminiimonas sp. CN]